MLTDFQNSFIDRLSGKHAIESYLNIPPHLNYGATLPCEISIYLCSKNDGPCAIEIEANCHVKLSH